MAVPASVASGKSKPTLAMTGLGVLSGILSATVGWGLELEWLRPLARLFVLDVGPTPIGLFYAAAIAVGLWIATRRALAVPVAFVATMYAWSAAIHTAIRLQSHREDAWWLIAASLAAGAVGALITHLGCAVFSGELRRPARIALTTAVGAAAGLLFYFGERDWIDDRVLFVVWQPAVAAAIGLGLATRTVDERAV